MLFYGPFCALFLAYCFTWLARDRAPRLGFVDHPDGGRKRHNGPTPLLGGLAILISFAATILLVGLFDATNSAQQSTFLGPMFLSGMLFCLVGLWDDRYPLAARDKFLYQVLASLPFALLGPSIESLHFLGFNCTLGPLSIPFTIFWLVACANIINLVDGLDGLATSMGLVATLTLAVLSVFSERWGVAFVAMTFAGTVLGFLVHNWPPARIFLGDAGSLMIGYFVGAIAMESSLKTATGFMLALPLVVLSIPILDTSMAILRRKLTGRGIGVADRGHIHHRLLDRGLTKLQTLVAILGLSGAMAGATIAASIYRVDRIAILVCVTIVAMLVFGRIFGFHEILLVFRHIRWFNSVVRNLGRSLASRSLIMRLENCQGVGQDELWDGLRQRVEAMGGVELEFTCEETSQHAVLAHRKWNAVHASDNRDATWQLCCAFDRGLNQRATIVATGITRGGIDPAMDDLFRVFDAFGRHWQIDMETTPDPEFIQFGDSVEASALSDRKAA